MRMTDTPYDAAMTRSKQELARQLVDANARIEPLEAALRQIMLQNVEPYCREIAQAALAPEAK